MQNKPTISIIIPAHNSANYIPRIKDCLFTQSFSDFEAIFIVSGDDETGKILKEVAVADPRIKIIEDSNSSYGHKINVGIEVAQGEYISILESDDEYAPDFLEQLKTVMESESGKTLDFVKGNFAMFADLPKGRKCLEMKLASSEACETIIDLQQDPQYRRNLYTHIWTGLYRKNFLTDNNIKCNESPGASFQDAGFSILCALYGRKIKFAPKAIYLYRMDNVKSSSKDDSKYLCIRDEFDWVKSELNKRGLYEGEGMMYFESCRLTSYFWNAKRLHEIPREKFLNEIHTQVYEEYTDFHDENYRGIINYLLGKDTTELQEALESKSTVNKLLSFLSEKKQCVLWGVTDIGREVLELQDLLESKAIVKLLDNNPALIGNNILGYRVKKPVIGPDSVDYRYILTGRRRTPELMQILLDAGVEQECILQLTEPINKEEFMLAIGQRK